MAGIDPLSALRATKKAEEQSRPTPAPKAAVAPLFPDEDDVAAALARPRRGGEEPASLFETDDPFTLVGAPTPAPLGDGGGGGHRPAVKQGLAAGPPGEDPFLLVLNNNSGGTPSTGSEAAKAAIGDAAKAAQSAFSAFGGFLREKAGPSIAAAAASHSAASRGGGGDWSAGAQGFAALAGRAQPLPAQSAAGNATANFDDMLMGEKVHVVVKSCFLLVANPLCELRGRLLATNYRLKFQTPRGTLRDELQWMREVNYFDVPMGMIEDVKQETVSTVTGAPEYRLKIATKDLRTLVLLPSTDMDCAMVVDAVAAFGVPRNPALLFAFRHAEAVWANKAMPSENNGWHIYNPAQEYARMGIDTDVAPNPESPWRLSQVNADYSLCATYPFKLALPRRMSDAELRIVAGFRKRGRLPAMSWCGGRELSYASLWRCSQTTEGLMGQKCREDEKMVELIRLGAGSGADRDLLVIDLRPWKAAWANKAGGGGFEGYPRCNLVFGEIDNIHCVRDAWRGMTAAVAGVVDGEVGTWFKDVAASCWYDYIGAILNSTLKVVKEIHNQRCSVMVHCSDGWDRTAQLTSLAMLCLDPAYRTQAGLLTLVQKEWCSFGHRFRTRMALGEPPTGEYCPVFIQWLECVYQVVRQAPEEFEYSPAILLRLANEVATNRFGTFLCDSEGERHEKVMPFSISLWSVLLRPEDKATWRNESYRPSQKVIVPNICQAGYVVWEEYWWRYHPRGQHSKVSRPAPFGLAGPQAAAAPAPGSFSASASPSDCRTPGAAVDAEFPSDSPVLGAPRPAAAAEDGARPPDEPAPAAQAADVAFAPGPRPAGVDSLFQASEPAEEAKPSGPPMSLFADDDDDDVFAKR